jgi:rhodanese-related sulfurtransferase
MAIAVTKLNSDPRETIGRNKWHSPHSWYESAREQSRQLLSELAAQKRFQQALWMIETSRGGFYRSPSFSLGQTILRHHQSKYEWLKEVNMERTISTEDLKAKLDRREPFTVVETLAPEGFREAHIPGALNIPPEQIKALAPQLLPSKDAEIITYCTSMHWHASEYAARELAAMGYTNVAHYPEGKLGWMEAGLPLEKAA